MMRNDCARMWLCHSTLSSMLEKQSYECTHLNCIRFTMCTVLIWFSNEMQFFNSCVCACNAFIIRRNNNDKNNIKVSLEKSMLTCWRQALNMHWHWLFLPNTVLRIKSIQNRLGYIIRCIHHSPIHSFTHKHQCKIHILLFLRKTYDCRSANCMK